MLSRSCLLVLWGLLAPSQAARAARKRAETDSSSSLNASVEASVQVANPDMADPSRVLSLDIEPQELLADVISRIGDFDFSEDIGAQIASLAGATFLGALEMVNPILGAVVSVFAGLLGVNGADPNSALIKNILAQVDKMTTQSIANFRNELTQQDIQGTLNMIKRADTKFEWIVVGSAIHKEVGSIFTDACWNSPNSVNCQTWRTTGGGVRALIYEIEYTQMMISVHLELRRLSENATDQKDKSQYIDKAEDLVEDIKAAGSRCLSHAYAWKAYRAALKNFNIGSYKQAENRRRLWCNIYQGRDLFMNKEYTGPNCWASSDTHRRRTASYPREDSRVPWDDKWGRRRNPHPHIMHQFHHCQNGWIHQVGTACNDLIQQAIAVNKVAGKMKTSW